MNCPRCGATVPAEDINIRRLVAKCGACNDVFSFSENDADRTPTSGFASQVGNDDDEPEGLAVLRPPYVQEDETVGRLTFQFRWFTPSLMFLLFFCIGWDAFLLVWYFIAFQVSALMPVNILMIVFPIVHVAVGVALNYAVVAGFMNRTTVAVDRSRLEVRHGPLPWRGNVTIPIERLRQLFCRREGAGSDDDSPGRAFSIYAILDDGTRIEVLTRQNDCDLVLYLEHRIEEFLGIVDVPVVGELPKVA